MGLPDLEWWVGRSLVRTLANGYEPEITENQPQNDTEFSVVWHL